VESSWMRLVLFFLFLFIHLAAQKWGCHRGQTAAEGVGDRGQLEQMMTTYVCECVWVNVCVPLHCVPLH